MVYKVCKVCKLCGLYEYYKLYFLIHKKGCIQSQKGVSPV